MKLYEVATARAGDKGDVSDISVIAYGRSDFDYLRQHLTAERVHRHFADLVSGPVERYEIPQLKTLKFVMRGALGGGVTRSLRLDIHGKTFGSTILDITLPAPDDAILPTTIEHI